MTLPRNDSSFHPKQYPTPVFVHSSNMVERIPILSVAVAGWHLASKAFAKEERKYRRRQRWKSFFGALINPRFASAWFDTLKSPDLLMVVGQRQEIYLKPFRVYMSVRWTKEQKIKVILDTYRFIISRGGTFPNVISLRNELEIARFKLNDTMEGVLVLGYDYRYRKEGELVMSFNCDQAGGLIAAAAFSFEELEAGSWACRIACIQGHKQNVENPSKVIQKLLHGLRPKSLMVFALQEFSRQLGCTAVYGAGDAIQAYRRKHAIHLPWRHSINFDYDAIWSESGGQPNADGWYQLPLKAVQRSMTEIKTTKRALYQRRYSLLENLSLKIDESVKRIVGRI